MENQLAEVNARLKKGDGWIGYRYAKKGSPSKFLYLLFYQNGEQKSVNTKTNDPEEAYKKLLAIRNHVEEGNRVLPSEVSKIKYEDLIEHLMEYYTEDLPSAIRTRKKEDGSTETTFDGKDKLDQFFKNLPITQITAAKIKEFITWRRKAGDADATIRRQLGRLRTAFERFKDTDLITDSHIPTFRLPKDSEPREGFLEIEDFEKFLKALPKHLHLAVIFLYYTGRRFGNLKKITWSMVSTDNAEIIMPGRIIKDRKPDVVPLVGPLAVISVALVAARKKFPKPSDKVFDLTNFRWLWNNTCNKLGLGKFDSKTRRYSGLHPHDFRRSAARNLVKQGVDEHTAMKITGHKTNAMFKRYAIKTTDDIKEALIKVGQFKPASVVPIAESSATR